MRLNALTYLLEGDYQSDYQASELDGGDTRHDGQANISDSGVGVGGGGLISSQPCRNSHFVQLNQKLESTREQVAE